MAPEVIQVSPNAPYGISCDMWSIGVITFVLLGGYPPFDDTTGSNVLCHRTVCQTVP